MLPERTSEASSVSNDLQKKQFSHAAVTGGLVLLSGMETIAFKSALSITVTTMVVECLLAGGPQGVAEAYRTMWNYSGDRNDDDGNDGMDKAGKTLKRIENFVRKVIPRLKPSFAVSPFLRQTAAEVT